MAVIPPPTVTALPTPPSTASPSNFDTRGDAFLGALPTFQTETDAVAANVYANAIDAAASAGDATDQATAASGSAAAASASAAAATTIMGAAVWVSGTTYALGAAVKSPANGRIYFKTTATAAGTTDPSANPTDWKAVDLSPVVVVVSGTTQTAAAFSQYVLTNVAATTVTLPASPASGDTVWITVTNGLTTNVIARNGQTIMVVSEDMTIDNANATVELRFVNSSWRLV